MPTTFSHPEFQERLHRIIDLLFGQHTWKTDPDIKRHLDHGLLRRIHMMEHSLTVLAKLPSAGSPALPLHQVESTNTSLNALYLNIRGSLDNTAWALTYHFRLLDSPDESQTKHRQFVNLFGERFLTALGERDHELASRLREHAPWGKQLAAVRDPAAHRIPLYIPPFVLDEAGAERVAMIDREMEEAAARGDMQAFHEAMTQRWNAGRFQPVIGLSEQEGLAVVFLPKVLNRDLGGLLDSLELVVAFTFAAKARTLASNCGPLPRRLIATHRN